MNDKKTSSGSSGRGSTRYGLSELGWNELTVDQRAAHYNRQAVCEHPYVYVGPDDEAIRESYSFDPYFHTAHMLPHNVDLFFKGLCECHTCAGKFGIPRDQEKRRVSEVLTCQKLTGGSCTHSEHENLRH